MGADNLINFHKWYKWREISQNCKILVLTDMDTKQISKINSFKD